MEIKNRNILMNLGQDEEVVYVAEKSKSDFYCHVILILGLLGAILYMYIFKNDYFQSSMLILISISFGVFVLGLLFLRDYFFTELILTNQRFIISRFNKLIFIPNDHIDRIYGSCFLNKGPDVTKIKLKSKKTFLFYFIEGNVIQSKFREIFINYDDKN